VPEADCPLEETVPGAEAADGGFFAAGPWTATPGRARPGRGANRFDYGQSFGSSCADPV